MAVRLPDVPRALLERYLCPRLTVNELHAFALSSSLGNALVVCYLREAFGNGHKCESCISRSAGILLSESLQESIYQFPIDEYSLDDRSRRDHICTVAESVLQRSTLYSENLITSLLTVTIENCSAILHQPSLGECQESQSIDSWYGSLWQAFHFISPLVMGILVNRLLKSCPNVITTHTVVSFTEKYSERKGRWMSKTFEFLLGFLDRGDTGNALGFSVQNSKSLAFSFIPQVPYANCSPFNAAQVLRDLTPRWSPSSTAIFLSALIQYGGWGLVSEIISDMHCCSSPALVASILQHMGVKIFTRLLATFSQNAWFTADVRGNLVTLVKNSWSNDKKYALGRYIESHKLE